MLSILTKDPQSIHKQNQWGQTPLHLAVGWPFDVNALIKKGANVDMPDGFHRTPLWYALFNGFAETVSLLMKADCSLRIDRFSHPIELAIAPCVGLQTLHRNASMERHEATLTVFIASLAERRLQLSRISATASISEGVNPCWAQNDRVLDEHASCAENTLEHYDIGYSQTSVCLTNLSSVYHVHSLTAEIAEKLWQAGFHDIDGPDHFFPFYQTPLSKSIFYYQEDFLMKIELKSWLIGKGANIYRPILRFDTEPVGLRAGREQPLIVQYVALTITPNRYMILQLCVQREEPCTIWLRVWPI